MGTRRRRKHLLEPTTGPIEWMIREYDDFDVLRISMVFSSSPAELENIDVWYRTPGDESDVKVRTIDPNGLKSVSFEGIGGIESGDWISVEYSNAGGVEISGIAVVDV